VILNQVILHRYILRQILLPAVLSFVSLNLLFLVVQLLKVAELAAGAGLGLLDLLGVALLFLPGFCVLTIPISVLTGVLLGFGRMTADGELVGLAGAGLSARRIAVSPLGLGLAATGLAVAVAGLLVPASTAALHRTFVDMSKRQVVASLDPGRFYEEIPRMVLYPQKAGQEPGVYNGFLVFDRRPDRDRHLVVANRARIQPRQDGNFLALSFEDGEVHARGRRGLYSVARFNRAEISIDIHQLVADRTRFLPTLEQMSLHELSAAAEDPQRTRRARNLSASAWHRRFAFPAAALAFALLGCALGLTGRLRGRRRTMVAAVLVVAAYYLLMRLGDAVVDKGWLGPAPAAWLPDFLVFAVGFWWMVRRERRPG
jgi:lipopolysaccharide export system permease protein